jgi:hypothetical protein
MKRKAHFVAQSCDVVPGRDARPNFIGHDIALGALACAFDNAEKVQAEHSLGRCRYGDHERVALYCCLQTPGNGRRDERTVRILACLVPLQFQAISTQALEIFVALGHRNVPRPGLGNWFLQAKIGAARRDALLKQGEAEGRTGVMSTEQCSSDWHDAPCTRRK